MADKITFDLVIQRLRELETMAKGFNQSSTSAGNITKNVKELRKELKQANQEAAKLQKTLGTNNANQAMRTMSRGSASTQFRLAAQQGDLRNLEATLDQMFARVMNKNAARMTNVIRAAQNMQVQGLAASRQSNASTDPRQLARQIEAQTYRVAQAEVALATARGRGNKQQRTDLLQEQSALDNLIATKDKMAAQAKLNAANDKRIAREAMENQKAQKREIDKRIAAENKAANAPSREQKFATGRENKLESLLGDGGASLLKIQAALLVNAQLMSAAFQSFGFATQQTIEYDKVMREFQAITETTDTQMRDLSDSFLEVSKSSRFSGIELGKAAITLGQAGLSARQVGEAIEGVSKLAVASGSDLATSADVVTSALTVFNLNASETGRVADVMTASLNLSKLSMDKLQLGIQYAGNAAAESGTTIEELVAALGAMSNAGIKSGSTLGTGLTQLFVEFQNPSKKLAKELKAVGLTLADVDVKSRGLTNVMKTLTDSGFSSSSAFRSLDLRAARAYLALSRNVDTAKEYEEALQDTTAATDAQDIQMKSLANTAQSLSNSIGALLIKDLEGLKNSLTLVLGSVRDVVAGFKEMPTVLSFVGKALGALVGGAIVVHLAKLTSSLFGFTKALQLVQAEQKKTALTTGLLGTAFSTLMKNPIFWAAAGIAALSTSIGAFANTNQEAAEKLDRLTASMNEAKGEYDATQQRMESLDAEMNRVMDRYVSLSKNSGELRTEVLGLQNRFGDLSDDLRTDTITTVDQLIAKIREMKAELMSVSMGNLTEFLNAQTQVRFEQLNQLNSRAQALKNGPGAPNSALLGAAGIYGGSIVRYNKSDNPKDKELLALEARLQSFRNVDSTSKNILANQPAADRLGGDITKLANQYQSELTELTRKKISKNSEEYRQVEERFDFLKQIRVGYRNLHKDMEDGIKAEKATAELTISQNAAYVAKQDELQGIKQRLAVAKSKNDKAAIAVEMKKAEEFQKMIDSPEAGKAMGFVSNTSDTVASSYLKNTLGTEAASIAADARIVGENLEGTAKATRDYFGAITEKMKTSLEEVMRELEMSTQATQNEIDRMDAITAEVTDRDRGALRGKYSDAELAMMEDYKRDLETQKYAERLAAIDKALPRLESVANQQLKVYDEAVKRSASKKDGSGVQAENATLKDYNATLDEYNKLVAERDKLDTIILARSGQLVYANKSLGEQIAYTLEKYREQMQLQSDLKINITENITTQLDNARSSFKSFIVDWTSGTATAGSAFRAFSLGVVSNLQEMAAEAVSNQLFGALLKFAAPMITGLFGGGQTVYDSPIGPTTPNMPVFHGMINGGSIKRAATGTPITRDGVPILGQVGEYILRKSAVDMIGRDNLDAINANGNRRIQSSSAAVQNASANATMGDDSERIVNIYVVGPEGKPTLSRNDVLVTIQDDLSKMGKTAQIIKRLRV